MQDWSTPLIIAATAFLTVLLWRIRPAFGPRRRASREALRDARARIESSVDEQARARALCDAADVLAKGLRGAANATGLYMRAIRSDPRSVEVVHRAVVGLARRPRALESLLWRHLAMSPWSGPSRESTRAALEALRTLYDGMLKNPVRARALANAIDALK
jgi:hypothetical protein